MRRSIQGGLAAAMAAALVACASTPPHAAERWGSPPQLPDLVEQVSSSVVQVASERTAPSFEGPIPGGPLEEFFERAFPELFPEDGGEPPPREVLMAGSGFFTGPPGVIVTSDHIVEDAAWVAVRLKDGRELAARVVGTDPMTDIAVLAVEAADLPPPLPWGASEEARAGEPVFTIGAPYGLGGTVTAGIVSARGRDLGAGPYDDFIQIDAPINQGNSGGPLFDASGRVIGVTSIILSPTGGNIGLGFAVPSAIASDVVEDIVTRGAVERGWLGVSIQPVTPAIAASLGLDQIAGALVAEVTPGSPAAEAGLQPGDVVLAFDEDPILTARDLSTRAAAADAGQRARLVVHRDGRERVVTVATGRMPEPVVAPPAPPPPAPVPEPGAGEETEIAALGLSLQDAPDGVVVSAVDPHGPAASVGLQPGDRVRLASQDAVGDVEDVARAVEAAVDVGAVLLQIEREGRRQYVGIPIALS